MELSGKIMLFGGMLLLIISQLYVVAKAFTYKFAQGLFCIFIPAYAFYFALREETRLTRAIKLYSLGIIMLIIGAVMLSF